MRRVLIVAYYFPPIGGIGSIRLARFAEHLPSFGWDPLVLAPRDTPHQHDPNLRFPEDRVIRSRSIELSRLGQGQPRDDASDERSDRRSVRSAIRNAGRQLVFPDAQVGWYPGAVVAGLRALRGTRVDAIYSSSFPITAHLVGRSLSRRLGVPWVAEFRDPWSAALPPGAPTRRPAAALERAIASEAAGLVMTSPSWAAHFGSRWQREISVIPNGFDELHTSSVPEPEERTIGYLGTYYAGRQSLQPLWQALARMRAGGGGDPPRLRFIGELPPGGRAEIAAAGIEDLVVETGVVSHDEAMRLLVSSTVLVACGETHDNPVSRGWIPAKLFEYLATPRPIVYLGRQTDDVAAMLRDRGGCWVVPHDDPAGMDAALAAALRQTTCDRDVEDLSRRAGARRLAAVLDGAARSPRSG